MAFQNEPTKINNEQMALSQLLEIAEFFRSPENRSETIDDIWTFEKINSTLRNIVTPFNPDLKQASFEEVLDFLKELLPEEMTQTVVPDSEFLKELIENSELAASVSDEIRRNAIAKAEKEISDLYRKNLEKKLVEKLTQSPIPPEERTKIAEDLSFDLQKNIENSGLPLSCQKLENTPVETPEHQMLEQQIGFSFSNLWQTAVNKTAATHNLSAGQAEYLRKLSSPAYELTKPLQTWAMINRQEEQIYQRIAEGLSPSLSLEERTMAAEEITETLVLNHVLTKVRETPVHSTPEKRSRETRVEWKKAVDAFLEKRLASTETQSLTLPDKQLTEISFILDEMQKTVSDQTEKISRILSPALAPEKASLVASELIKHLPDNLSEFASPLPTSREIENAVIASIWQMVGSEIPLKPQEATGIASALTANPQIIIPLRRFYQSAPMSKVNPLQITENGKTVIQQVKEIVFKEGINLNPESDRKLTALKQNLQAAVLIQAGITPQDLETQVQVLIKSGQTENSPQVREIRAVQKLLPEFIQKAQTAGFPVKTIQNWQKQNLPPVRLFLSRFNTVLRKIGFPEKIQLSLFQNIRKWFLNTGLGRPIKYALEKSAQKSLQTLWTAGREGIKKIAIPAIQKILVALGIGAKTALVAATNIVGIVLLVVPKLIGKVKDFIKGIFSSGTRVFGSILSGLTGGQDIPEDSDTKWLKWVFIGVFVFLFFGVFFERNVKSGAMISLKAGELGEPGFTSPGLPAQCQPSRHFAEEVKCTLQACNITTIVPLTISSMQSCFDQSSLQGKNILKSVFSSVIRACSACKEALQCVGFVDGIQKALGKDMGPQKTACLYFTNPPANYTLISGSQRPIVGDVVIWSGPTCGDTWKRGYASQDGHLGIVIEVSSDTNLIFVAQANGFNGEISIKRYPFGDPNNSSDPNGFLRHGVSRF